MTLELDGQEIQSLNETLSPNSAAAVTFQPITLSNPHTRGTVRLPDDDLTTDNTHHFVVSPGNALPVLIVEAARAPSDVSLYLRGALSISDDGRFEVRTRRSSTIRPVDLEGVGAVFLNNVVIDGGSAERLRAFVADGGGVFVALGQGAGWPASAADLLPGTLGQMEDRLQGRGGRLGFLDYEHPIFEVFAGPRSGDFTGARFYRAWRLQPSDSAAILARYDDGSVALAEVRHGRGRVLAWTSSLDAFWNDLALQPVFLPYVHRLAEYLGGRAEAAPWFVTGQVVDLADPEALETAGLVSSEAAGLAEGLDQVAVLPSGGTVTMPAGAGPRYLPLDEHGFYTVRRPGTDPDRPFVMAVNADLEESDLASIDPEELVLQIEASAATTDGRPAMGDAVELRREDQERRQSFWRWLLVVALGLFIAETAISNYLSRKRAGAGAGLAG
ncbi:MAG: hypothetical protein HKN72_15260 [Gemmatimonadetes bacterium]|nr:hypothetical protein [Gemmatimonadota bacterium]